MVKVIESKYTKLEMNVFIIEPKIINKDTKVFILLHGLGGNETNFVKKTNISELVDKYNIIAVCPEGNDSWYVHEYYNYINEEVFNLYSNLDTYIAGFSMGGYGAAYIGLQNEKYKAIGIISGSIDIVTRDYDKRKENNKNWISIFGDELNNKYDLFNYLDNDRFLYVTIGNNDHLLECNRNFLRNIKHNNYLYKETKGAHNWEFVKKELEPMISELIYESRD